MRLAAAGDRRMSEVAQELGIRGEMLRQWKRQAQTRAAHPPRSPTAISCTETRGHLCAQTINGRHEVKSALKLLIAASAISVSSACKAHESIVFAGAPSETVRLLDASSGRPIPDINIRLHSGNAIVCDKAPCPPDSADWKGSSDPAGRVIIPKGAIEMSAIAETDAYAPDLLDNATQRESGGWDLELTSKDSSGNDPHPLKLFDADSKKPLVGMPVRLEFNDPHGVTHTVDLVTNALGYVFVPFQIAAVGKHSLIRVHRYSLQFVEFRETHHNIYFSPRTSVKGNSSSY